MGDDEEAPALAPADADVEDAAATTANGDGDGDVNGNTNNANEPSSPTPTIRRNINSYYGHRIGFLQTLSLTLNAGLMVYAHLGLSAVILSSRDPSSLASANANAPAAAPPPVNGGEDGDGDGDNGDGGNGTAIITGGGKCNARDLNLWADYGGEATRGEHSNYCSRVYGDDVGCLLDAACIETCIQETYGYSEECSSCFGGIPICSVMIECTFICAADGLGPECAECNAPCIADFDACTGLPEVIPAAADDAREGKCDERDAEIWIENGGEATRGEHSNYCSRAYGDVGCLLDAACIETCIQETNGYSEECSSCFGAIPMCSVMNECTYICAADSLGPECAECNTPCIADFDACTGLPKADANNGTSPTGNETVDADATTLPPNAAVAADACNDFDLDAIETWYDVYDLTFVKSINDAWNGDAKLLAVIIVLFSGIWPYLKNILLVIVWYWPTTAENQTSMLLWLSRLSKYTLVDVFAIIGVLVGVQLQLDIGGTEAVTRAEPRFGIIAFFLATVWEFLQIELIKAMHERKVLGNGGNGDNDIAPSDGNAEQQRQWQERLQFKRLWVPLLVLAVSLVLYIAGAASEVVYFASTDIGNAGGVCKKSYNLVTLGNALVNDLSMTSNSAPGQTWILYLSYVVLNLLFPILTHVLQICFIFGWSRSKKLKRLMDWTLAIWCFACIEVLLIGIFAVEYKFPNLIMKIAGDTNAAFLDIDSELGTGFYLLIAYSVVAGFLQSSLRIRDEKPAPPAAQAISDGGDG